VQLDELNLQIILVTGGLAFGLLLGRIRPDTANTSGWPPPALIYPREGPEPETARPGTSGWTPPAQLQRAGQPEETEEALPPPDWPPPDRDR
jgi:hypothetical protein